MPTQTFRILVVDDNRLLRSFLAESFRMAGHDAIEAPDGQVALDALRADASLIDAVLMDLNMPVLDGISATRQLRADARFVNLPVYAFTGGSSLPEPDGTLFTRMLVKPMPPDSVVQIVLADLRMPQPCV
jgi:two-component system, sensor histidine kinase and response regulator